MGKKAGSIVLGLIVVGGFFGYMFYSKSEANKEAKAAIMSWVVDAKEYKANKDSFDSLVEEAHPGAFEASYSMGSRRRSAKFDVVKYGDLAFGTMKAKAEKDGKPEIAKSIQVTWDEFKKQQADQAAGAK